MIAKTIKRDLPSTLAMPESTGVQKGITFERVIASAHREVEGVTPKQLQAK
jgi:hypothetical protein